MYYFRLKAVSNLPPVLGQPNWHGMFACCVAFHGLLARHMTKRYILINSTLWSFGFLYLTDIWWPASTVTWLTGREFPFTLYRLAGTDPKLRRATCVVRSWQLLLSHCMILSSVLIHKIARLPWNCLCNFSKQYSRCECVAYCKINLSVTNLLSLIGYFAISFC